MPNMQSIFKMNPYIYIKNKFSNYSIRKKLIVFFSFIVIAISLFIFIYFPNKLESQYIESLIDNAQTITNITAGNISPALVYYTDTLTIKESINEVVKNNRNIAYIIVKDENNSIIYNFNDEISTEERYENISKNMSISSSGLILKVNKSIYHNERHLGSIVVGISLHNIKNNIDKSRFSIAIISFVLLVLGLLVVYVFSSIIASELNKVVDTFELIAEGDLNQRVIVNSKDEIGALSESFNLMVDKLQSAYCELQNEINIRKKTEEKLNIARIELSNALEEEKIINDMKSRFISMVSHEYRTPLTVILTSSYLLEVFYQNRKEDEFYKQLSRINSSIEDMTLLLNNVLEIGKFSSSKNFVKSERIELVDSLKELVSFHQLKDKQNHRIIFSHNVKQCEITSDRTLVNHIISNLLTNALKYSPENSNIIIELFDDQAFVKIIFKDFGIGIPKEDIEILFEPFYRGRNVASISGTGLGLSIVKNSVDSLKGKIYVESEENNGAIFTVTLPKNMNQNTNFIA